MAGEKDLDLQLLSLKMDGFMEEEEQMMGTLFIQLLLLLELVKN
jgi:hypothetical protein